MKYFKLLCNRDATKLKMAQQQWLQRMHREATKENLTWDIFCILATYYLKLHPIAGEIKSWTLHTVSCSPGIRTSVPLKCLACAAGPDHRVTTFTTILIIFSCLSISRCTALSWSLWSMASDNTLDHTHHILDHTHQSQKFGVAESLSRGGRCKARLPSNY